VLALFAAVVVAQGLVYPLVAGAATAMGVRLVAYYWLPTADLLNLAAVALAHLLMLRWIEHRPWSDVALGPSALRPRSLALGALLGGLAIAAPVGALVGVHLLRVLPGPDGSSLGTAGALLVKLAPAALAEELLVRGFPFMVLRESVGVWAAIVVTSLVFGVLHVLNPGATVVSLAMVALAGVFLGGVLVATGSLWAAFAAHLAWNWTLSALLHTPVSGLPFVTPDYRIVDAGPDWITGGSWGPEGGLAAGVGMCAALVVLVAVHRRRTTHARGPMAAGDLVDG
jgi:membrane protease YdiL (CAAX protease family)